MTEARSIRFCFSSSLPGSLKKRDLSLLFLQKTFSHQLRFSCSPSLSPHPLSSESDRNDGVLLHTRTEGAWGSWGGGGVAAQNGGDEMLISCVL